MLANYVSGQTPAQSVSSSADLSGYGVRDISAAWIVFALSDYDRLKHNLDPDVKVKVLHMADGAFATRGDRSDPVLVDVHFLSAGDSPAHTSLSWRNLDASSDTMSFLQVQAVGSREISVVAEPPLPHHFLLLDFWSRNCFWLAVLIVGFFDYVDWLLASFMGLRWISGQFNDWIGWPENNCV
jgi:hypothetical protein